MKQLSLIFAIALLPFSVMAEEDRGLSLMERGAQLFMEGILKEMEPAIDEFSGLAEQMGPALKNFADEMGPKLADLLDQVEDWSVYQAPEILPNGDIIIRRKPDHPLEKPDTPTEPAPQVDL
ncbi:MAG: hypothetical protein ACJAVM_001472 [Sulfitobacter sp.]|jgi:hypothetical protein